MLEKVRSNCKPLTKLYEDYFQIQTRSLVESSNIDLQKSDWKRAVWELSELESSRFVNVRNITFAWNLGHRRIGQNPTAHSIIMLETGQIGIGLSELDSRLVAAKH